MLCSKCYRGFIHVLSYLSETGTLLLKYQGFTFTYTFVNIISNGSPVMESTCCQLFFFYRSHCQDFATEHERNHTRGAPEGACLCVDAYILVIRLYYSV